MVCRCGKQIPIGGNRWSRWLFVRGGAFVCNFMVYAVCKFNFRTIIMLF